ncbi:Zn-dependent hydrolase [Actinopolyspora erythraea]|uniref:Allantoate amidohydrolase n=1 Tax=Actinopolyspora erythraea TaxID=414996 RepID=A0A099D445_9ACTN|nr:allantoate amidohydrolase [Actinopolyspora erythraea]ASU77698.1 Zn-dependent hydrolase [Actinopolyspora erythraea]KGI80090.1 allantoate amidohydrolase [Actinopolyspora erythraea]
MPSPSELLADIRRVGRDRERGGYSRHVFERCELELREWFVEQAARRGLEVLPDGNGNIWAWWPAPGDGAVATGSHLDSVPGGGEFDGPLGVVSALCAVDRLRAEGFRPRRPLALVVFAEEEGGRFGVPCLGSGLATGTVAPERALALRDESGTSLAEAMRAAGVDPERAGPDRTNLPRVARFVELHVEQGRGLAHRQRPLGVASTILAHGRWRFRFTGQGNHAGATPLDDRRDPMLPASLLVSEARRTAARYDDARATVGRIRPVPSGTNVIAASVDLWLDARAHSDADTRGMVEELRHRAEALAAEEGCAVRLSEESYSDTVSFDGPLRDELTGMLAAPELPTGAGHDAGVLAARIPTGMLFVRNPTGVSHAPEEHAEPADCDAGAEALATVLRRWSR